MSVESSLQAAARSPETGLSTGLPAHPGIQSVFESHGPVAEQTEALTWVLLGGAALVYVLVLALAVCALLGPKHWRSQLGRPRFIIAAGAVFPGVVLSALLAYNVVQTAGITASLGPQPLRLEVIGEQWWWRVHYLDAKGEPEFATANEIRIPTGRPIELTLRSADVIHSFWVPNLAGKLDMVPGKVNTLQLRADRSGIYRGQCAEFCGIAHGQMALYVVALGDADFENWLALQRQPAPAASEPASRRGQRLFEQRGCGACHTARGTSASGILGPDLTHVGGRLSLAAGLLPVNPGTLAGWTASSQHLKPGNKMPSFNGFSGAEQRELAAWLASLR